MARHSLFLFIYLLVGTYVSDSVGDDGKTAYWKVRDLKRPVKLRQAPNAKSKVDLEIERGVPLVIIQNPSGQHRFQNGLRTWFYVTTICNDKLLGCIQGWVPRGYLKKMDTQGKSDPDYSLISQENNESLNFIPSIDTVNTTNGDESDEEMSIDSTYEPEPICSPVMTISEINKQMGGNLQIKSGDKFEVVGAKTSFTITENNGLYINANGASVPSIFCIKNGKIEAKLYLTQFQQTFANKPAIINVKIDAITSERILITSDDVDFNGQIRQVTQ